MHPAKGNPRILDAGIVRFSKTTVFEARKQREILEGKIQPEKSWSTLGQ